MNQGWIKLHRKALCSMAFQNEGLWKVWTWCLLKANHEKAWVPVQTGSGSTEVEVQPGQFIYGRNVAANELKMKPSTVHDRMKKLEKAQNLVIQPGTHFSIISIVNWCSYQNISPEEQQAVRQPADNQATGRQQPADTNKNDKNDKNSLYPSKSPQKIIYTESFLAFWEIYPNKVGKGEAFKAYQKIKNPRPSLKDVKETLFWQIESDQWQDKQFIPYPATYLNQRRWEDEKPINGATTKHLSPEEIRINYGVE